MATTVRRDPLAFLGSELDTLKQQGLYRRLRILEGEQRAKTTFDRRQVVVNPWGTLTFIFTDCDHGRVDFSSVAGYGSGSMNLTRLTQPAGLACT